MKLRTQILLFLFLFALVPLVAAVLINLPLVLDRLELFYQQAYLQNLRADFRDLDQHLASRDEMVRLLAKLPEPGSVLGVAKDLSDDEVDLARARYTSWINQVLSDQLDIVQLVFRVSPLVVDPEAGAEDPRHYMTLKLASPIGLAPGVQPMGTVLVTVDVAGIAHRYRNTLWVNGDGSYLRPAGLRARPGSAFDDFPGLRELFATGDLALWRGPQGRQVMWVPLLRTVQGNPLWVGRAVDPSPLTAFRQALTLRVLSIVLGLIVVIWLIARPIAVRMERFGHELGEGIRRVLEEDTAVRFAWRGPHELRSLGENLTRLAERHARNSRNLRAHARELEASNRYKSEFLANVSHELRTPLNSILLLSKLLAEDADALSPERARQARVIHSAGRDLLTLIDNILDLSRIEAGRATFTLEQIDLPQLLEDLLELLRPQFDAKGLALRLVIDPQAPRQIDSDPDKIRQVLKNFLSNAVKFTAAGEVVVRLHQATGKEALRCPVAISVTDTGIGIRADKQSAIFEAFTQADGSTSRKYGGSGLGLTISRELARLIGGAIALESREGAGSTFTLLLPLQFDRSAVAADQIALPPADEGQSPNAAEPADRERPSPDARFDGQRVLVVGGSVDELLALTPLLEGWGLLVGAAGDAAEAIDSLHDEADCALVLLDVAPPGREACVTIRRIREAVMPKRLPVLAMADPSVPAPECEDVGAAELLVKPLDPAVLREAIARHCDRGAAAAGTDEA